MKKNCFPDNFIEIGGDCTTYTTASSGIRINDLAGISLKMLSDIVDGETTTGLQLARQCHKEAINRTVEDFIHHISDTFNYKNVYADTFVGRIADELSAQVGDSFVGWEFEKVDCDRYTCMYIQGFKFFAPVAGNYTITIIDGGKSTPYTFTFEQGYNEVCIDYAVTNKIVQVVYDQTGVPIPSSLRCDAGRYGCNKSTACGCTYNYQGFASSRIEGDGNRFSDSNRYSGLSVNVQIKCEKMALVCIFKDDLKYAIRYAMGISLLEHAKVSRRATAYVRNSKEDIDELLSLWDGMRNKETGFRDSGKYQQEIKKVAESAKLFLSAQIGQTNCLYCSGARVEYSTP